MAETPGAGEAINKSKFRWWECSTNCNSGTLFECSTWWRKHLTQVKYPNH